MKQLILSGGGDIEETTAVDSFYFSLLPKQPKILYIPIAWKSGDYTSCREWFGRLVRKYGIPHFDMWSDLEDKSFNDVEQFDSIYIGGGNTFKLLHQLRSTGFIDVLRSFIHSGKPVYGGSAGAIILGSDIQTAGWGVDADTNDVGLADFTGLDEVYGNAVQCHYFADQHEQITQWVASAHTPVIALSESSGIYVTDSGITRLGDGVVSFDVL